MGIIVVQLVNRFLKLLNSETRPSQLAAGFCFGVIVGLSPFFTWHNLLIFLLVCLLRVNFSMFFASVAIFSILGFFLDPLFDRVGYFLLVESEGLRSLWVTFSITPGLPFFRFNNTVVLGSLIFGLVLFPILFGALVVSIRKYRTHWRESIMKSRWIKALKASGLYKIYMKIENLRTFWRRWST